MISRSKELSGHFTAILKPIHFILLGTILFENINMKVAYQHTLLGREALEEDLGYSLIP